MYRILTLTLFFLLICVAGSNAQQKNDSILLENKEFADSTYKPYHPKFLLSTSRNLIVKYNPVSLAFGSLLFFYQNVFSIQISSRCSYELSCSNFSKAAIKEYGILKGVALSADRLMRCNKLAAIDISISDLDFEKKKVRDDLSQYRLKH